MATRHPFAIVPEWILPIVSGNELATYCAIASFSDGENDCYPSVDRIAERCGKDRRAVQRALVTLAEKGLIEVERRQGRSNKYWLTRHQGGGENDTPQGAVKTTAGVRSKSPQGCGENHHPEDTNKETTQETSTFDEFYKRYPRKVGRANARKAYVAAIKRGVTPQALLESLDGFRFSDDPKFIPHPASWLNGERYLDEQDGGSVLPEDYIY